MRASGDFSQDKDKKGKVIQEMVTSQEKKTNEVIVSWSRRLNIKKRKASGCWSLLPSISIANLSFFLAIDRDQRQGHPRNLNRLKTDFLEAIIARDLVLWVLLLF